MIYSKKKSSSKFKFFLTFVFLILIFWGLKTFNLGFKNGNGKIVEPLPELSFSEKIELGLKELDLLPIGPPVLSGETIWATVSGGMVIYFKINSDYTKELASLQLILKNIRIEGTWPKRIDLRYSRPIIEY